MSKKKILKPAKKVGRPSLLENADAVRKLEFAFSIGCTVLLACQHAEVSRDAFYAAIKKDKSFSDRIEKLKQNPIMKAVQTIFKHLDDVKVAMWFLERRQPEVYGIKSETGIDTSTEQPKLITEEEMRTIIIEHKKLIREK